MTSIRSHGQTLTARRIGASIADVVSTPRRGKQRTKRSVAPVGVNSTTGFLGERLIDASTTHTHAAALC